jgi:hypothetical protein
MKGSKRQKRENQKQYKVPRSRECLWGRAQEQKEPVRRRAGTEGACQKESRNRRSLLEGEQEQKEPVRRRSGTEGSSDEESRNRRLV